MDETEFKIADALIEAQEKRIAEFEAALRDIVHYWRDVHYWREYGDNEGDIEKYIKRGEAALKGKS